MTPVQIVFLSGSIRATDLCPAPGSIMYPIKLNVAWVFCRGSAASSASNSWLQIRSRPISVKTSARLQMTDSHSTTISRVHTHEAVGWAAPLEGPHHHCHGKQKLSSGHLGPYAHCSSERGLKRIQQKTKAAAQWNSPNMSILNTMQYHGQSLHAQD